MYIRSLENTLQGLCMVQPNRSAQGQEIGGPSSSPGPVTSEGLAISFDSMTSLGAMVRERRTRLGLTLSQLAERVGCAKSYLSQIETGVRDRPPGMALLGRLESALGLQPGRLVEVAQWQSTPEAVKQRVADSQQAARRLRELLSSGGNGREALDRAFGSGELRRLVELMDPTGSHGSTSDGSLEPVMLPREVPVINSVSAGYPTEFTDLGYPARVADAYVRVPDIRDADAFGARVVGDSMLPEYVEGDVVVFSPAAEVVSGADCFVRLEPDHETTFKRIYFETDESGSQLIRLQPLNSAYAPRVVPREQVAGLYSAVSVVRSLVGPGGSRGNRPAGGASGREW